MAHTVSLPAGFVEEIIAAESGECESLGPDDAATIIRAALSASGGLYSIVEPFLAAYAKPRVLEIGSGNGLHLCDLLLRGVDAHGVEPGEAPFDGRFLRAIRLLETNGIADARRRLLPSRAEALPYPDSAFDVVTSAAVMEHVQDLECAMREAVRVTKPGGVLVLQMPNYDSFYEGHYRITWLPYVLRDKRLARFYVGTIRRRPTEFLHGLNFTTPSRLERLARSCGGVTETKVFYNSFSKASYVTAAHRALDLGLYGKLGRLSPFAKAPVVGSVMRTSAAVAANALAAIGMAPEFTIVCRKS